MSSIFTSVSSAVSDIGQEIYNLYDRQFAIVQELPQTKIAIIISKNADKTASQFAHALNDR